MTKDDPLVRIGEAERDAQNVSPEKRDVEPVVEVRPTEASAKGGVSEAASPWRRLVLAAGPLALAAAMILYVTSQSGPSVADLPAYTVTAVGAQPIRGPAGSSTRLRVPKAARSDARFEVLLRPATAPQEKVVAYAFTFQGSASEPAPLEAKVEIAPEGAVKLTGSSRALEGAAEIRIVVGVPLAIGKFDDAATRARSAKSDAHVQVLTVPIDRE